MRRAREYMCCVCRVCRVCRVCVCVSMLCVCVVCVFCIFVSPLNNMLLYGLPIPLLKASPYIMCCLCGWPPTKKRKHQNYSQTVFCKFGLALSSVLFFCVTSQLRVVPLVPYTMCCSSGWPKQSLFQNISSHVAFAWFLTFWARGSPTCRYLVNVASS
jgi:hypothetical protein